MTYYVKCLRSTDRTVYAHLSVFYRSRSSIYTAATGGLVI